MEEGISDSELFEIKKRFDDAYSHHRELVRLRISEKVNISDTEICDAIDTMCLAKREFDNAIKQYKQQISPNNSTR